MIPVKELRIGNKFQMIGSTMVNTVFDISDNTRHGQLNQNVGYSHLITVEENGNQYKPIEMDGVPLTEDWLLKFGFEKHKSLITDSYTKSYFVEKQLSITIQPGNQYAYIRDFDALVVVRNSDYHGPFYVHQLQNLYFCLTGEELTIK